MAEGEFESRTRINVTTQNRTQKTHPIYIVFPSLSHLFTSHTYCSPYITFYSLSLSFSISYILRVIGKPNNFLIDNEGNF